MYDRQRLQGFLNKGKDKKNRPIQYATRVILNDDNSISIKHHDTNIITHYTDGSIMLTTGGWKTKTSKDRLNDYSSGWNVWSINGVWYIGWGDWIKGGARQHTFYFTDGMVFYPDGRVEGAEKINPEEEKKLRKLTRDISEYCHAWAEEFIAGKIHRPRPCDCFCCAFIPEGNVADNHTNTSHLVSHMEEKYYVPSLLYLACTHPNSKKMLSRFTLSTIAVMWGDDEEIKAKWRENDMLEIASRQIYTCLRRYFRQQFNLGQN